jgi:glutathione S-transferase
VTHGRLSIADKNASNVVLSSSHPSSSGFWLGPRLSVADVALFAQLHSLRTSLTPWQRDSVEARESLRQWLDRVDVATRSGEAQQSTPRLARVG